MMTSQICVTCIVGLAHHIKFTWRHRFKEKYRKTVWYNFFLKLTLGYCVPLTVSITVNFPETFVKMNIRKFWKFRCISVPYFLIDRGSLSITQKSYENFCKTGLQKWPKPLFKPYRNYQNNWNFWTFPKILKIGQIHKFQKCIQNRPSTLRGQDKQLFLFFEWVLAWYEGRCVNDFVYPFDGCCLYGRTSLIWTLLKLQIF